MILYRGDTLKFLAAAGNLHWRAAFYLVQTANKLQIQLDCWSSQIMI